MKAFELKKINYKYIKDREVLKDINLDIYAGEKALILGANGCGKTTLLSILNGLIFPVLGEIKFMGNCLTEKALDNKDFNRFFRRKVGYVFQNPEVQLFCPTVEEELKFGPIQMGLSKSELRESLDETVEIFNLKDLLDRAPFSLSFGEKKRVCIASVYILNTDVILLDEPTTGLDPKNKSLLKTLIQKLHKNGKTIIISTHDMQIIDEKTDRLILFGGNNTIIKSDKAQNIINDAEILSYAGLL